MAFKVPKKKIVEIEVGGGGSITARALVWLEILTIYRSHKKNLDEVWAMVNDTKVSEEKVIFALVQNAPTALYEAIAIAADVPEMIEEVASLPPKAQMQILYSIAEQTLDSFGMDINNMGKMEDLVGALTAQAKKSKK